MHSITKLTLTALRLAAIPVVAAAQDSTRREAPVRDTLTTGAVTMPSDRTATAGAPYLQDERLQELLDHAQSMAG